MSAQPFYHQMSVQFTATEDVCEEANSEDFRASLERFLKRELGCVVTGRVELDGQVTAEPGDPSDL